MVLSVPFHYQFFFLFSIELRDDVSDDALMDTGDVPEPNGSSGQSYLTTLVAPLLTLVQPTALSFSPLAAQSIHPPTTSALGAVHIAALECLNNIFLSFSTVPNLSVTSDTDGGLRVWHGIWSALSLVGTQAGLGQERRKEFWDVAVGVLWSVGRVWKGHLVSDTVWVRNAFSDYLYSDPEHRANQFADPALQLNLF